MIFACRARLLGNFAARPIGPPQPIGARPAGMPAHPSNHRPPARDPRPRAPEPICPQKSRRRTAAVISLAARVLPVCCQRPLRPPLLPRPGSSPSDFQIHRPLPSTAQEPIRTPIVPLPLVLDSAAWTLTTSPAPVCISTRRPSPLPPPPSLLRPPLSRIRKELGLSGTLWHSRAGCGIPPASLDAKAAVCIVLRGETERRRVTGFQRQPPHSPPPPPPSRQANPARAGGKRRPGERDRAPCSISPQVFEPSPGAAATRSCISLVSSPSSILGCFLKTQTPIHRLDHAVCGTCTADQHRSAFPA